MVLALRWLTFSLLNSESKPVTASCSSVKTSSRITTNAKSRRSRKLIRIIPRLLLLLTMSVWVVLLMTTTMRRSFVVLLTLLHVTQASRFISMANVFRLSHSRNTLSCMLLNSNTKNWRLVGRSVLPTLMTVSSTSRSLTVLKLLMVVLTWISSAYNFLKSFVSSSRRSTRLMLSLLKFVSTLRCSLMRRSSIHVTLLKPKKS